MKRYVDENLRSDEIVVQRAEINKVVFYIMCAIAVVFMIIGIVSMVSLLEDMPSLAVIILLVFLALAALLVFESYVKTFKTELAITDKRVIGKLGLFRTRTLDAPLNKINTASVSQGIIGKILNYSTVRVDTSSLDFSFEYIKDAEQFKQVVMLEIENFNNSAKNA